MAALPGFPGVVRFQWDAGNADKSWRRHQVTQAEAEQAFFNRPILVTSDPDHSGTEDRLFALGQTDGGRRLAIVFTIRGDSLRVISARPMSRQERRVYG
jgi:uncharacterized DUF497 family protein